MHLDTRHPPRFSLVPYDLTGPLPVASLAKLLLAPAFGIAMALAFAAAWLLLDRAATPRMLFACLTFAVASTLSAVVALVANRVLARRPWTSRFAAALLILITGVGVLTSFLMAVETAWTRHEILELSPKLVLVVLTFTSVGSLYGFLTIGGFLILPLGMPMIVLAAALIASHPSYPRRSTRTRRPGMEQP